MTSVGPADHRRPGHVSSLEELDMQPQPSEVLVFRLMSLVLALAGLVMLGSVYLVVRGKVSWIERWRRAGVPITVRMYAVLIGLAGLASIYGTLVLLTPAAGLLRVILLACSLPVWLVVLQRVIHIFRQERR